MAPNDLKRRAIALYDEFTHNTLDRRGFLAELTRLAGSTVAANALLAAIAPDALAAPQIAPDDRRIVQGVEKATDGDVSWSAYTAAPARRAPQRMAVLVIHENRGLTEHIRDVTRRVALAGYRAFAPDFLAPMGGTPADENVAREMIGKLAPADALAQATALIDSLRRASPDVAIGVTGFCWGGALTNRIAVAAGAKVAAAAPFYGPCPAPAEATGVQAAMLLHFAENDPRVNVTAQPWIDALKAAGVSTAAHFYPGTEHAFHNDTAAARYNQAAAELAWTRTLAHFKTHLA